MTDATFTVHWPGQDTDACGDHAQKLQNLGRVLGIEVSMTAIESPGVPCANCENEARKIR